jgi:hypothetical protein
MNCRHEEITLRKRRVVAYADKLAQGGRFVTRGNAKRVAALCAATRPEFALSVSVRC